MSDLMSSVCPEEYIPGPGTMVTPADFTPFPWMKYADNELRQGQHGIPGSKHNPRIIQYFSSVSGNVNDDDTPWCSAFANWVMEQANIAGTGLANARSWYTWGQPLPDSAPVYGAIAVLWRGSPSSWKGHVGFYVGREGDRLFLLGGNQGNAVNISHYRISRLLGFRWPPQCGAPTQSYL